MLVQSLKVKGVTTLPGPMKTLVDLIVFNKMVFDNYCYYL